jgi:hypothetical protein
MSLQDDNNPLLDGPEVLAKMEQHTPEEAAKTDVEVYRTKEGNFKFKLKMRPFSTYDHSKPPTPKKMMHGWLPERRTAAILAAGGKLKSTLIVDQAIETAKLGKLAVIVSAEDESDDYYGKFWTALKTPESRHYGLDIVELSKFISVVDISGTGWKLSASPDNLGQRAKWVDNLIEDIQSMGKKVGFVAFETASRLCYGEENNDFAAAITVTDHVAMTLNCSSVISHHTAKFVAREKVVDNHAGRGGSALGDNTRSSLTMTSLDANYGGIRLPQCSQAEIKEGRIVEMAHTRSSFGQTIEPRYFRAKNGLGGFPIMEEIPSLKRGTQEAIEWKASQKENGELDAATQILAYMQDEFDSGRDYIGSDVIENEEVRHKVLPGIARNPARAAMAKLVEEGKVIKVKKGTGRPVQYYLTGNEDTSEPEKPVREVYSEAANDLELNPEIEANAAPY